MLPASHFSEERLQGTEPGQSFSARKVIKVEGNDRLHLQDVAVFFVGAGSGREVKTSCQSPFSHVAPGCSSCSLWRILISSGQSTCEHISPAAPPVPIDRNDPYARLEIGRGTLR